MVYKKYLKKLISFIVTLSVMATVAGCISGCSEKSSEKQYMIYYANISADDVIHRDYDMPGDDKKDSYEKVSELMHQMYEVDLSDEGFFSSKPANVTINDFVIDENGLITIDFSPEYLELSNVSEIILRAALVLTVIQVDGIIGAEITVEGDSIRYSTGAAIGVMTADDFVNILLNENGMLKQETDVVLFFANETGEKLVPVTYHLVITNNSSSIEEYILSQLIAGPAPESGAFPTLAADVELLSVTTAEKTCYVNFSESFLEQEQPVSDELLIFSIVNSLCRLRYVNSVQFLIDGEVVETMHKITDISKPLSRNRSLEES